MYMIPKNITGKQVLNTAQNVSIGSLRAYKAVLRTKMAAADMALNGLTALKKDIAPTITTTNQKESKNMKGFLTAATLLAVTGVALGAAGYYLYKKEKELCEYEDILFNDQLMDEYEIAVEDEDLSADMDEETLSEPEEV